jgi:L-cystine uptake protein TcyP (sodium:dicarboxylate symporter family)
MSDSLFSITMVVLVGLLAGVVVGLLIGFLAKKQRPLWSDMTGAEKWINFLLVAGCSAIFIIVLSWRFLLR